MRVAVRGAAGVAVGVLVGSGVLVAVWVGGIGVLVAVLTGGAGVFVAVFAGGMTV